jgi:hypothetical protein
MKRLRDCMLFRGRSTSAPLSCLEKRNRLRVLLTLVLIKNRLRDLLIQAHTDRVKGQGKLGVIQLPLSLLIMKKRNPTNKLLASHA